MPARVPLRQAATAQGVAILVTLALMNLAPASAASDHLANWVLLQGIVAAGVGRAIGMEAWWIPIHALFAPGIFYSLEFNLPPAYALAAFLLLLSVYWNVARTRVPLFLSSKVASQALASLLPLKGGFNFLDIGSGFGGVLASLARERPAGRYFGIESAPVPFLLSRMRAALETQSFSVSWGDFEDLDLSRYDVVYAYLSPAAMGELWRKARREMRGGTLLISNSFAVPGVAPALAVATDPQSGSSLLVWRM